MYAVKDVVSVNYSSVRVFFVCIFVLLFNEFVHYCKKKSNNFYGETSDNVVSEKSEARIRTRKHREKISSFFKFWRPCFMSVYFFIKIFFRKGELFRTSLFHQLCSNMHNSCMYYPFPNRTILRLSHTPYQPQFHSSIV